MNRFITKHWLGLAVVAVLFLLFVSKLASAQTPAPEITPTYLSGYMTCGANEDGSRMCPFRLHYVNLDRNTTYMIRMESSDLDPRLSIEDVYGNVLATDYDYYDTLYGVIVFRPAESGRYRLVADALTPMEGFYSITIRELPVVLSVRDALVATDLPVNGTFERSYDLTLMAGRRYIIDLDSPHFDAFVKLLNADGAIVAFEDECGTMRNARVVFEPTMTATYRVVATSYADRATGAFRLMVCEE